MLTSSAHIEEIFAEALELPLVKAAVEAGKAKPSLYRLSRRALRGGDPKCYRGFARYETGEISLTLGPACCEANAALLILHEIAHIISPERGHGSGFKLTFCQLVDELYGIKLHGLIRERYHVLDARAGIAIALLLAEGEEPEEDSAAWWVIETRGRRTLPRYFSKTQRAIWDARETAEAASLARARAARIRRRRELAAASGKIA